MTEHQLTEILIRSNERGREVCSASKHLIIANAGIEFGYVEDVMTVSAKVLHDRPRNAFIANEIQAASSDVGYTTSARNASAAKLNAAAIASLLRRG